MFILTVAETAFGEANCKFGKTEKHCTNFVTNVVTFFVKSTFSTEFCNIILINKKMRKQLYLDIKERLKTVKTRLASNFLSTATLAYSQQSHCKRD